MEGIDAYAQQLERELDQINESVMEDNSALLVSELEAKVRSLEEDKEKLVALVQKQMKLIEGLKARNNTRKLLKV
jgi:hypothetical protein